MNRIKKAIFASVSWVAIIGGAGAAYGRLDAPAIANDVVIKWNIPAQPLSGALIAWSEQSNYVVLVQDELTAGIHTLGLTGSFTKFEALERLLESSGLTYKIRDAETLVVMARLQSASMTMPRANSNAAGPGGRRSMRLAQATEAIPQRPSTEENRPEPDDSDMVVVTGTRIRGAPPAAPQRTITRAEIDASGQSQIGEILRNIPQNSPGGSNRGVQATPIADAAANQSNATTVNLRGLGPDATLVLVNGHRLATDSHWGGPDVSVIPVSAIERIEIVTDGASALYGSDAVAGVANFVLRSDFSGAEASARFGGATQGGGFEQAYNAMAGGAWRSGHVLGGVEYHNQNAIDVRDRSFTSTALPGNRLLPPQERVSAFFGGRQEIGDSARFELTALYADRSAEYAGETALPGLPVTLLSQSDVHVVSRFVAPRLAVDIGDSWTLSLDAVNSVSDNHSTITTSFGTTQTDDIRNATNSVELNAQGDLLTLPTGRLKVAAGGGYREETQVYSSANNALNREGERDIFYAYAETLIPLIAKSDSRRGLHEFDLSAALRFEDYSDFGSTVNPRLGVRFVPTHSLVLRGTWGKSFKAPLFRQLSTPLSAALFPAAAMGAPGPGAGIAVSGGNTDLDPERSTSWTAGVDWSPAWADTLRLSLTYFDVDYEDRIVLPIPSLGLAFSDPDLSPFILLDPTPAQQAEVISNAASFFNNTGAPYDPADVVGIAFSSFVNVSAQTFRGVDISASYAIDLKDWRIDLFADASWLDFSQRTLPTQEMTTRSGLIFYPAQWRARGGATLSAERFASTAAVNYVAGSTDNFASPTARISPWATLDLNFRYRLPDWSRSVNGLEVALSITNALDNDPPFAAGGGAVTPGLFFDGSNSSPVGRFIAVTLRQAL